MRIHEFGDGTPEVAVVGGIHGDEPCGARAVERLVAENPDVDRPVKLIVANEEALEDGVRYLDEDLNRAFPGDPEADTHERRLAYDLRRELHGCTTLSLHSTQSYAEPFTLVSTVDAVTRGLVPHLPVDALVETDKFTNGRLIEGTHTIEAECGLQGTDAAAENAYWLVRAFLAGAGAMTAPTAEGASAALTGRGEVPVFRLEEEIPKPEAEEYEVFVANFERVAAGERFAAADGRELVADEPFYPVLLSAYGYRSVFGYAADRVGTLE